MKNKDIFKKAIALEECISDDWAYGYEKGYEDALKKNPKPEIKGWIQFTGNENLFNESAKNNCMCKFDDGSLRMFEDEHPLAILTHFRID